MCDVFAGGMALRNYLINTNVQFNIIITFYYDNACFNAVLNEYLWAEKKKYISISYTLRRCRYNSIYVFIHYVLYLIGF